MCSGEYGIANPVLVRCSSITQGSTAGVIGYKLTVTSGVVGFVNCHRATDSDDEPLYNIVLRFHI